MSITQFDTGPVPIPALAGPATYELDLPSTHSYGYGYQSSSAFVHVWPARASGMLMQYAG